MTQQYDYDLLVIGAGSGGVRAARMAATQGARVAVIELFGRHLCECGLRTQETLCLCLAIRPDFQGFRWIWLHCRQKAQFQLAYAARQ